MCPWGWTPWGSMSWTRADELRILIVSPGPRRSQLISIFPVEVLASTEPERFSSRMFPDAVSTLASRAPPMT